jgi:hypothetical protein
LWSCWILWLISWMTKIYNNPFFDTTA